MSKIIAVIGVIRELIALVKLFIKWQADERVAAIEKQKAELEKAARDLKNAKTEEEFDEASDRLHDNSF